MSTASVAEATAAPSPRWLRIVLIVVAAAETLSAVWDLPGIFYQYDHPTALLIVAQALIKVKIALAAPLAAAALVFAVRARPRLAIALLGLLIVVRWALDVPTSWMIHGVELSGGSPGLVLFAQQFIYPLIGLAAVALARRNQRLGLAVGLVALPPLIAIAMVVGFAIAVSIHGF